MRKYTDANDIHIVLKVKQLHQQKLAEYNRRVENPSSEERKRRDKYLIKKMEKLVNHFHFSIFVGSVHAFFTNMFVPIFLSKPCVT